MRMAVWLQAWYEDSGITFQLLIVLLVNMVAFDFAKVTQPLTVIKSKILAPLFMSEAKIAHYVKPPRVR